MNLVQIALRRPISVLVLIVAIILGSIMAIRQMSRDIFPISGFR